MHDNDWNDLIPAWKSSTSVDGDLLLRKVKRRQRWRNLGLVSELVGAAAALLVVAWAWNTPSSQGMHGWLLAAAVIVVSWQVGFLLIRHRHGLFGPPPGGLVGLFDAEIRRARYVVASLWFGAAGGIVALVVAWLLLPAQAHDKLSLGALLAAAWFIPYTVIRGWRLSRWMVRLRIERARLLD